MKTKSLFKAAFVALLFAACSSEDNSRTDSNALNLKINDSAEEVEVGDGESLRALEQANRENGRQFFVFEAGEDGEESITLTSEMGVDITLNPRELTVRGRQVNGTVRLEFGEIFGIGAMAATGISTTGIQEGEVSPDNPRRPLITGGEFFVNITTEEGEDVDDGTPFTLAVPTELTGGEENSDGMIVWTAEEDENGDVTWERDLDEDGQEKEVPVVDGKYIMDLLSFGLCNIDKLEAIEGEERTSISVDVPDGYDDTNSRVYLAYQGNQNFLFRIWTFDQGTQMFEDPYDNVPVGATFNVIFVSGQGNQWIFAVKQVTIAGNDIITIDQSDLGTTNNAAFISFLNNLP